MTRRLVDPARLIRPYTHSSCVMSRTPTPYTYTLLHRNIGTQNRNAKQERESAGEREENVEQERRNAECEGKIEESGHA